jgi:AraC family transcriptional regulator
MLQGLHGKRLAQHVGLVHSSSLVLKPPSGLDLALTHLKAPNGLDGPSARIKSEPAHILTVHLKRPGLVKGWGMWTEGRFRPTTFWDIGGIDIVDLRADPIVLRQSEFETLQVYIPHETLYAHVSESGCAEMPEFQAQAGVKDELLLRWVRTFLPFLGEQYRLPAMAMNEMVTLLLGYLVKTFATSAAGQGNSLGGLALWQKRRASQMIHAHLNGDLTLTDLAAECGLSPGHFARAFKRSFGIPAHQYLIQQRVKMARTLLLHSDQSLLSIALECGFTDQSAFNRTFRSMIGAAPGAWQRQQRSLPIQIAVSNGKLSAQSFTST